MHVLQWIAVQTDSKDLALRTVRDTLETELGTEEQMNSWFDWFVVGGGRWNVAEGEDWKTGYNEKTNMIINYKEEPEKFVDTINEFIDGRKKHFDDYRKDIDLDKINSVLEAYDPNTPDYSTFSNMYAIKKCIDIIIGEWDFNSGFYDMHNQSTSSKWCLESLDKEPDSWYLVPVDFHF